jgi:hypothetical protein
MLGFNRAQRNFLVVIRLSLMAKALGVVALVLLLIKFGVVQ